MLAELASTSFLPRSTLRKETEAINPDELLEGLECRMTATNETTGPDVSNEPTKMLTNFGLRPELFHDSKFFETPTAVIEMSPAVEQSSADNREEGIEALYNRLMGLHLSLLEPTPSTFDSQSRGTSEISSVTKPDMNIVPHIIALQLEMADTQWEVALGWTTYLFSNDLHGHQARRKKDEIVAQATKDMDEIIDQALYEEELYRGTEDKNRIPRRIIVSNLAAGAGEDDLQKFFYPLRYMM